MHFPYFEFLFFITAVGFLGTYCFICHSLYWLWCHQTFSFCGRSGAAMFVVMAGVHGKQGPPLPPPPHSYLKMTHGWLQRVRVTFEVTHTCCINDAVFSTRGWPPPLSSRLPSCRPHLCRLPELFVTGDLIIKWERCWVSYRRLRSTWLLVISFPFSHTATLMKAHTSIKKLNNDSAHAQVLGSCPQYCREQPHTLGPTLSSCLPNTRCISTQSPTSICFILYSIAQYTDICHM